MISLVHSALHAVSLVARYRSTRACAKCPSNGLQRSAHAFPLTFDCLPLTSHCLPLDLLLPFVDLPLPSLDPTDLIFCNVSIAFFRCISAFVLSLRAVSVSAEARGRQVELHELSQHLRAKAEEVAFPLPFIDLLPFHCFSLTFHSLALRFLALPLPFYQRLMPLLVVLQVAESTAIQGELLQAVGDAKREKQSMLARCTALEDERTQDSLRQQKLQRELDSMSAQHAEAVQAAGDAKRGRQEALAKSTELEDERAQDSARDQKLHQKLQRELDSVSAQYAEAVQAVSDAKQARQEALARHSALEDERAQDSLRHQKLQRELESLSAQHSEVVQAASDAMNARQEALSKHASFEGELRPLQRELDTSEVERHRLSEEVRAVGPGGVTLLNSLSLSHPASTLGPGGVTF